MIGTDEGEGISVSHQSTQPAAPRGVLAVFTATSFIVFAQAFMIAPLLPRLADVFDTTPGVVGLAVPAYLVPYGIMTLVWGPLSDRVGRRPVILASLLAFSLLSAVTAVSDSAEVFISLRLATALGASGAVPIALAMIGDIFPYHHRGRALGWLFGGMAGGTAVGAAGGALIEPLIGWTGLFVIVGVCGFVLLAVAMKLLPAISAPSSAPPLSQIATDYAALLRNKRAQRTYGYVFFNAILHSGVYTWLGVYLHQRYGLSELGIGLTLLGYGIPGFLLGPVIGRLADRHGRARLVPCGVAVGALCAMLLAAPLPLILVQVAIVTLSLGYDMTQPALGGIVTDLPANRGQAMGLNVFTLFTGMGVGALVFQIVLLQTSFAVTFAVFGIAAVLAAGIAVPLFADERPSPHVDIPA